LKYQTVKGRNDSPKTREVNRVFFSRQQYLSERFRNRKDLKRYHEQISGLIIGLIVQSYTDTKQIELARVAHESTGDDLEQDRTNMIRFANAFVEPAHEAIRSGAPGRFVLRKGDRWIEYTILPLLKNIEGAVCKLELSLRDVTERRLVEEALDKVVDKYRVSLDAALAGIGITDFEGNMYYANFRMLEMTSFSLGELKLLGIAAIYAKPNDAKQIIKTLVKSGKVRDCKVRLKRKNGVTYSAIQNVDRVDLGGKDLLFTTVHDIGK